MQVQAICCLLALMVVDVFAATQTVTQAVSASSLAGTGSQTTPITVGGFTASGVLTGVSLSYSASTDTFAGVITNPSGNAQTTTTNFYYVQPKLTITLVDATGFTFYTFTKLADSQEYPDSGDGGSTNANAALPIGPDSSTSYISASKSVAAQATPTTYTSGQTVDLGDFTGTSWTLEATANLIDQISTQPSGFVGNPGAYPNTVTNTVVGTNTGTLTALYTYTPSGGGTDPQFVGFQGQQYQIHGVPEEYFALVSTPDFQMNSRFIYIATGICSYNDTECFSHPGTYMDQVGFIMNEARIKVIAGTHANGLTAFLNNQPLSVGARILLPLSNSTYVHLVSKSRIVVSLDDFVFGITNSDYFFNIAAQLSNSKILTSGSTKLAIHSANAAEAAKQIATTYPEHQIHGLLGQTWRNIQWPHKKLIQGEPTDYLVANLYSSEFPYTQYQSRK